ncbi:protein FAM172A-like [Acanthaster planci]|uniref:Protein FAM172A-like n=1 Tax=Acanthaster planci TaxID=133434 RepID=A0A8B8A285_ACAPL|nr:protein FAM172A-like [Acanthaster planci]XP_022109972.1 protein FAM172A-like [Acanthaster planci]
MEESSQQSLMEAESQQIPVDSQQIPADSQQIPADSQQIPADSQQIPADSQQIPADSQQIPADSQQIPADSQQISSDSQMSVEQDFPESQSQMEMSQQSQAEESQPDRTTTVPKLPKLHRGSDADAATDSSASAATARAEQPEEPDDDVHQNGEGRGPGDTCTKEETEKLAESEAPTEGDERKIEEQWHVFPDTLEGFKYFFNDYGQLRHTDTGEPFVFEVRKGDMQYNQRHYEALGEVITEHVYGLLESEANLKRVYLGDAESEPRGFVFMSENARTTTDKLLILIHGSGVVRAGQWARRLIINDCLDSGTQLPYIRRAMQKGYEVLLMNTNENFATLSDGRRVSIKGSSSPREHGLNVWDSFVADTPAKHVAIVAHSYGGVVTIDLAAHRTESFRRKVFAVAFTDSVHSLHYGIDDDLFNWFTKNTVNWVSSREEVGTVIDDRGYDCPRVSAGTLRHEETSWYSYDSIFEFLSSKEQELKNFVGESSVARDASDAAGEDARKSEDTPGREDGDIEDTLGSQETEPQQAQHQENGGQETEIGGRETEL